MRAQSSRVYRDRANISRWGQYKLVRWTVLYETGFGLSLNGHVLVTLILDEQDEPLGEPWCETKGLAERG